MFDKSGQLVRIGDRVCFAGGLEGVVVSSFDAAEFSARYPESDWEYLGRGILVDTKEAGLIHLDVASPDLEKVSEGDR